MESLNDFHFLRPIWFVAILPLAWICYCLCKKRLDNTGLEAFIDKALLSHLVYGKNKKRSSLPIFGLLFIWLISIIALAGPTWEKVPQPLLSKESAVIIVLDLSPSMLAQDLKPSRIVRAHLKIHDFLSRRKEGLTALVVYAGEAYVVTPLTDDTKTISNLLPTLQPGILPIPGSNVEMGLKLAVNLVTDARLTNASVLLITDDINENAESEIIKQLPTSLSLSILGVGSDEGAPIPNKGDFLKDVSGNIIIAKRNSETMSAIAKKVNGYFLPIQADTSDIDFYSRQIEQQFNIDNVNSESQREYDAWYEFGPLLIALLTPMVALAFRRGLIIGLCLVLIPFGGLLPSNAYAASWWNSLWKNSDQRALESYKQEEYNGAADKFDNLEWKGSAHYKNRNYEAALEAFSQGDTAIADFNKGNALANLQRYDDAIGAYDKALKKKPSFEEAKANKKLIEDLQKKEEKNKEQEENNDDQKNQENKEKQDDQNSKNKDNRDNNSVDGSRDDTKDGSKKNDEPDKGKSSEPETKENESSQKDKQDSESEKQNNSDGNTSESIAQAQKEDGLSDEEQQALQQWLRKVPDDPSGLLKRKFEYEYQKRRQLYQKGEWQLPENNAHKRY